MTAAAAPTTDEQDYPRIEIRCRVDGSMLKLLRDFVCSVARHCHFSEAEIAQIEICVDEACANVIEHAYRVDPASSKHTFTRQDVLVEVAFKDDELHIRVIDYGAGTDPASENRIQELDQYLQCQEERLRGLGFYLMHHYMDEVLVKSHPGAGTTVEMVKRRLPEVS